MIGVYNKSVILTYVGIAFALFGIFIINADFDMALICLICSGICDLFDGVVARKCKRTDMEKKFGAQIDSLADVISFLVFPSVILITAGKSSLLSYFIAVFYTLAGVIRLAWFNLTDAGDRDFFIGVPVTYAALAIPVFYAIASQIEGIDFYYVLAVVCAGLAFLFLLKVKIKKPRGIWYLIFPLLAVFSAAVIMMR